MVDSKPYEQTGCFTQLYCYVCKACWIPDDDWNPDCEYCMRIKRLVKTHKKILLD